MLSLGSIETDRVISEPCYNEVIFYRNNSKIIDLGAMNWPCFIEIRIIMRGVITRLRCIINSFQFLRNSCILPFNTNGLSKISQGHTHFLRSRPKILERFPCPINFLLWFEILHNANSLHDQSHTIGWVGHGLHQADVVLFQRVQCGNSSIHGRHSYGKFSFTFILERKLSLRKLQKRGGKRPGPEIIERFSCSTHLSIK